MLDAPFIRENLDAVKRNCDNRNVNADVDRVVQLDDQRKRLAQELQLIQQQQNAIAGYERHAAHVDLSENGPRQTLAWLLKAQDLLDEVSDECGLRDQPGDRIGTLAPGRTVSAHPRTRESAGAAQRRPA